MCLGWFAGMLIVYVQIRDYVLYLAIKAAARAHVHLYLPFAGRAVKNNPKETFVQPHTKKPMFVLANKKAAAAAEQQCLPKPELCTSSSPLTLWGRTMNIPILSWMDKTLTHTHTDHLENGPEPDGSQAQRAQKCVCVCVYVVFLASYVEQFVTCYHGDTEQSQPSSNVSTYDVDVGNSPTASVFGVIHAVTLFSYLVSLSFIWFIAAPDRYQV